MDGCTTGKTCDCCGKLVKRVFFSENPDSVSFYSGVFDEFEYYPSPFALEKLSQAEQAACRIDERLRYGNMIPIVNDYLMDLDAVSSGRISGMHATISELIRRRLKRACQAAGVPIPDELAYSQSMEIPEACFELPRAVEAFA